MDTNHTKRATGNQLPTIAIHFTTGLPDGVVHRIAVTKFVDLATTDI